MAYNVKRKLRANIDAIKIALSFENGILTENELSTLKEYSGWGGIKCVLFPFGEIDQWEKLGATKEDLKHHEAVQELHNVLREHLSEKDYKETMQSVQNSILTSFYTPEVLPAAIYAVLGELKLGSVRLYEPSAGNGVFLMSALKAKGLDIDEIVAVEKDLITGRILRALASTFQVPTTVQIAALESTDDSENGESNLIISNIPFGNFSVYDPNPLFRDPALSGTIHNYFFAKGISKIADGGLLVFLTTDAFMNTPANKKAREYLFMNADFVSLLALPDNLMKDSANTEAPSHLLVVQKKANKQELTNIERELIEVVQLRTSDSKVYNMNSYLSKNKGAFIGNVSEGTNQYGKANLSIWEDGPIDGLFDRIKEKLKGDFGQRFVLKNFPVMEISASDEKLGLTFLELPSLPENGGGDQGLQLGLFDVPGVASKNEALRYITELDETVVDPGSARIVGTFKSVEFPEHDSIVLLQAKSLTRKGVYYFKLFSNLEEIVPGINWFNVALLGRELNNLQEELSGYRYQFRFDGEQSYNRLFEHQDLKPFTIDSVSPLLKVDALFIYQNRMGSIMEIDRERSTGVFKPYPKTEDLDFFTKYVAVRDSYLELFSYEHSTKVESAELRQRLNEKYDSFFESYGAFQKRENIARIQIADAPFGFSIAYSVERYEDGRIIKSDIFSKSLAVEEKVFMLSALDALPVCLNDKGSVDLNYIAGLSGLSVDECVSALQGHIFYYAGNRTWETIDKFRSGNVVEKLKVTNQALDPEPGNPVLKAALDLLQKAQPKRIPYGMLDFNLGERWIPIKLYSQFVTEFFNQETPVVYSKVLDRFEIGYKKREWNPVHDEEFCIVPISKQTIYGSTLMEYAFDNTSPQITYTVGEGDDKKTYRDSQATHLAYEKISEIRKRFERWMKERSLEVQEQIETLYNEMYNCTVIRKFDGTHLKFKDLDLAGLGIPDLYDSQKNAIWRIIQERGGLIDHEVGLGKTLTMIVASYEMKRLGIVRKPVILALKSTVRQIAETYKKAYPKAKLLFAKESDFQPAKRAQLFLLMKNNDWDCIILTHEQFGMIPQSDEIRWKILQDELDDVNANYQELVDSGEAKASRLLLKGLETRKANIRSSLEELQKEIESRKDKVVNFVEMGIDKLFVDESHKFKNLIMNTRHQRVAGLGGSGMVKKTLSLLYGIRELQERFGRDLCATFCSGTPLSNSMKEMFLQFKYLIPNELKRMRIENFDSWIAVFGRKSVDFEFSVTNEVISKERFRYFIKVPELALMYNNITDFRRASEVGLDRPEVEEVLVSIPPTPAQMEYIANLKLFARNGDGSLVGYKDGMQVDAKKGGLMLVATNLALKMTADMRLIYPGMADHPNSKANQCAARVAQIWRDTAHFKGTQMIFSDIGTPGEGKEFSLYSALKQKLVGEYGIPANEITFIHDWTDSKRPELYRKMNDGSIRVLLGSTEKAGTGLNVQERLMALHHIDVPWRPSDFEQRNGRGGRKGNWAAKLYGGNKVKAFIYAQEQSLDTYKFNILKNKQTFITQIKTNSLGVRSVDEGAMDEDTGMNYSEFLAVLSGDDTLLKKSKIEKQIGALESLKQTYQFDLVEAKRSLESTVRELERKRKDLVRLTEECEHYDTVLERDKEGTKVNRIRLSGLSGFGEDSYDERVGVALIKMATSSPSLDANGKALIGNLYDGHYECYACKAELAPVHGVDGEMKYELMTKFMVKSPRTGLSFVYNSGFVNRENPKIAARYFLNALDRVRVVREQHEKEVKELASKVDYFGASLSKPFDRDKELDSLKDQLKLLERTLEARLVDMPKDVPQKDLSEEEKKPVVKIRQKL